MTVRGPTGVFGGTFDPPHIGHLLAATYAREQFALERVVFIPAGQPYRKADRAVSEARHRVAMTALALAGHAGFELDLREVAREGPSYTVDTVRELREEGITDVILIFGSDAVEDMPNWKEPEALFELARVAVAPKGCGPVPTHFRGRPLLTIEMPRLEVSSTLVRERVRTGRPIAHLVPPSVEAYIAQHGLYR